MTPRNKLARKALQYPGSLSFNELCLISRNVRGLKKAGEKEAMKNPPRFSIRVRWGDEDECFIGTYRFPHTSAFGDSPEEATRELAIAIELAIQ